ncbi:hypothetical protein B0H10DRAFT_2201751 [Mycena sp. CBHHK59/15]|nr:hypothetical protein B0H10DRAFT_2201751 [Mycena sp. CBHHK59/15]
MCTSSKTVFMCIISGCKVLDSRIDLGAVAHHHLRLFNVTPHPPPLVRPLCCCASNERCRHPERSSVPSAFVTVSSGRRARSFHGAESSRASRASWGAAQGPAGGRNRGRGCRKASTTQLTQKEGPIEGPSLAVGSTVAVRSSRLVDRISGRSSGEWGVRMK